jgi:tRNA(Arg) A34 adenosine deaminase TadA
VNRVIYLTRRGISYMTKDDLLTQDPEGVGRALESDWLAQSAGSWSTSGEWLTVEAGLPDLDTVWQELVRNDTHSLRSWTDRLREQRALDAWFATREIHRVAPPQLAAVPLPRSAINAPHSDLREQMYMGLALSLVGVRRGLANQGRRGFEGQNIGCVLVGITGAIIGWGVNTNARNVTRHAETNCIQRYQELNGYAGLPRGSVLYTTLQSCPMCAGMLAHAALGELVVVYLDTDNTVTDSALKAHFSQCRERKSTVPVRHPQAVERWARLRTFIGQRGSGALMNEKEAQATAQAFRKGAVAAFVARSATTPTGSKLGEVGKKATQDAMSRYVNASRSARRNWQADIPDRGVTGRLIAPAASALFSQGAAQFEEFFWALREHFDEQDYLVYHQCSDLLRAAKQHGNI